MWRVGLVLLAMVAIGKTAEAEPRVAFVNLATDAAAGHGAIEAMRGDVVAYTGRKSIDAGAIRDALEVALPPARSRAALVLAAQARTAAEESIAEFELDAAISRVRSAEQRLRTLAPDVEVVDALVRANVMLARIHLLRKQRGDALAALRVVSNLAPKRTLDAAIYRRSLVRLFKRAVQANQRDRGTAMVITAEPAGAAIWVDGRRLGATRLKVALAAGDHYIASTHDGYVPTGTRAAVGGGAPATVALSLEPRSPAGRIVELRRAARVGLDDDSRRGRARAVATIAGAEIVVTLGDAVAGGREARVYTAKGDSLSAAIALAGSLKPLIDALPPRPTQLPSPVEVAARQLGAGPVAHVDSAPRRTRTAWYQTGWGEAAIIGGAAAVVATTVLLVLTLGETRYRVGGFCNAGNCQ